MEVYPKIVIYKIAKDKKTTLEYPLREYLNKNTYTEG